MQKTRVLTLIGGSVAFVTKRANDFLLKMEELGADVEKIEHSSVEHNTGYEFKVITTVLIVVACSDSILKDVNKASYEAAK